MVRFKNRYIVVAINCEGRFEISTHKLLTAVNKTVQLLHGDYGSAAIQFGLAAKYCNPWTKVAVIRARHGPHRLVASSLPFIKDVGNCEVVLHTLYTGATLRQCYKFIRLYQRRQLDKKWKNLKTDEEKKAMEEAVLALDPLEGFFFPVSKESNPELKT